MRMTRNHVWAQAHRGFESLTLRQFEFSRFSPRLAAKSATRFHGLGYLTCKRGSVSDLPASPAEPARRPKATLRRTRHSGSLPTQTAGSNRPDCAISASREARFFRFFCHPFLNHSVGTKCLPPPCLRADTHRQVAAPLCAR